MVRLLIFTVAVALVIECNFAMAQGRSGNGYRGSGFSIKAGRGSGLRRAHSAAKQVHQGGHDGHKSHYQSPSFGIRIDLGRYPNYGYSGFGYSDPYRFDSHGYDPYRYGSFKAPDLLDDPYYIQRHRYDSMFPGRRYRAPLEVRPGAAPTHYQSHGTTNTPDNAAPAVPPADLVGQLQSACQRLTRSLATRQDANVWIVYLAPEKISQLMATGNSVELRELLTHYDGIAGNPQLRSIAGVNGFNETRSLLTQYLGPK